VFRIQKQRTLTIKCCWGGAGELASFNLVNREPLKRSIEGLKPPGTAVDWTGGKDMIPPVVAARGSSGFFEAGVAGTVRSHTAHYTAEKKLILALGWLAQGKKPESVGPNSSTEENGDVKRTQGDTQKVIEKSIKERQCPKQGESKSRRKECKNWEKSERHESLLATKSL